jgi:hypothetical protein
MPSKNNSKTAKSTKPAAGWQPRPKVPEEELAKRFALLKPVAVRRTYLVISKTYLEEVALAIGEDGLPVFISAEKATVTLVTIKRAQAEKLKSKRVKERILDHWDGSTADTLSDYQQMIVDMTARQYRKYRHTARCKQDTPGLYLE